MRKTADREPVPGNSASWTPLLAPLPNPCPKISVPQPLAIAMKGVPQGLKPSNVDGLIGTTEVVPFHETTSPLRGFSSHLASVPHAEARG